MMMRRNAAYSLAAAGLGEQRWSLVKGIEGDSSGRVENMREFRRSAPVNLLPWTNIREKLEKIEDEQMKRPSKAQSTPDTLPDGRLWWWHRYQTGKRTDRHCPILVLLKRYNRETGSEL